MVFATGENYCCWYVTELLALLIYLILSRRFPNLQGTWLGCLPPVWLRAPTHLTQEPMLVY